MYRSIDHSDRTGNSEDPAITPEEVKKSEYMLLFWQFILVARP
jgi:hypothetical protein